MNRFTKSTILTIAFILILLFAACHPMRRESKMPVPVTGEIVEGRSVIVNIPGRNGHTFILEV